MSGHRSLGTRARPGEETDHITVEFLDDDGDVIDLDDDFYLDVDVANTAVAELEQDTRGSSAATPTASPSAKPR